MKDSFTKQRTKYGMGNERGWVRVDQTTGSLFSHQRYYRPLPFSSSIFRSLH